MRQSYSVWIKQGQVFVFCFGPIQSILLSLQSPRLSQQSLRVDWRTCGQTWPPSLFCSHGTESRPDKLPANMFFFLTEALWFQLLVEPSCWIFTWFFCFLYVGWVWQEPFGICWNHLRPSSRCLTDLWFLLSALCYIFCLYVDQTRLCLAFARVKITPWQHTKIPKICLKYPCLWWPCRWLGT